MKKVILITGATDGIGRQTAIELAQMGHLIIVHGRSEDRCKQVCKAIEKIGPAEIPQYVVADFSRMNLVKEMAEQIQQRWALDVLINNAGVFEKTRRLTAEKFEMTFAVNHLAHFFLTNLLMGNLKKGDRPVRIVNVSSIAHSRASFEPENLQGERFYDGYNAYAQSKLCNIMFTLELSRRLNGTQIRTNCLHPGVVTTKLLKAGFGSTGVDVSTGSQNSIYVATSPDLDNVSGKYFVNKKVNPVNPVAEDQDLCGFLWKHSEEILGKLGF